MDGIIDKVPEQENVESDCVTSKNEAKSDDDQQRDEKTAGDRNIETSQEETSKANKHEDVPEDFFDDFMKPDFMDGLDIVDEDEEEPEKTESFNEEGQTDNDKNIKVEDKKTELAPTKDLTNRKRGDEIKRGRSREEKYKVLDKEKNKSKSTRIKTGKTSIETNHLDIRRDPDKTREAIQRDKIKTAKDKEKRLITDIVQTGLVPPGMELEVDLNVVQKMESIDKNLPVKDLREKLRPRKSSRSIERSVRHNERQSISKTVRKKSSSPIPRKRLRSPVKEFKTFGGRSYQKTKVEKDQTRRTGRESPISLSPSPMNGHTLYRSSSPKRRSYRSSFRRTPTFSSRRSPIYRRKSKSRTPISKRRPSRDHTSSVYQKRSLSPRNRERRYMSRPRRDEKPSFLEELAVKLNQSNQQEQGSSSASTFPYGTLAASTYIRDLAPTPVPAPESSYFSLGHRDQSQGCLIPTQDYDMYDMNFFIGESSLSEQQKANVSAQYHSTARNASSNGYQDEFANTSKLFEDKSINLSDFLAITAKPQANVSSPEQLKEKIMVIQRCQEAVKIVSERKFTGALSVEKTNIYQTLTDENLSPLLRTPIVQLPFTTYGMKKEDENYFTGRCRNLLRKLGIEAKLPTKITDRSVDQKSTAVINEPIMSVMSDYYMSPSPNIVTKSTSAQTDRELSSCKECLHRKGILYANCGTQTSDPALKFSVSTNVTEADFYSMIPKTQSLASMTPAQLLGKQVFTGDVGNKGFTTRNRAMTDNSRFQNNMPPNLPKEDSRYSQSLMGSGFPPGLNQNRPSYSDMNRRSGYNRF